jgi:carboxyl-terminal processing protease
MDKPVAMLIDHGTRSVKEIVAYGFKKYGLGELVGSVTSKSVLGSQAFLMRDGSLLLLATSDIKVDGERLEGVGVTPTIEVDPPLPYRNGGDAQLERALALLAAKAH